MGNRLSKIVTRTGDAGTTGLGDGSRVTKDCLRIDAIGEVDELNSTLGVLLAEELPQDIRDALGRAGMPLRPNATETSGLHGAIWRDGRWDGGADPRREGMAVSETR